PEEQLRHGVAAHHAQPRYRRRVVRPGSGHVRGAHRRTGRRRRYLLPPRAPFHPGAHALDDLAVDAEAPLHPGCATRSGGAALRLPVPPTLPVRDGGLPGEGAGGCRSEAEPPRRVLAPWSRERDPTRRSSPTRARGDRHCRRSLTPQLPLSSTSVTSRSTSRSGGASCRGCSVVTRAL